LVFSLLNYQDDARPHKHKIYYGNGNKSEKSKKNDKQSNNEPENKQAGILSLHIAGTRSSVRLKKAPK